MTHGTIEERIVKRAQKKLMLDAMVLGSSTEDCAGEDAEGKGEESPDSSELLKTLRFGANAVLRPSSSRSLSDGDIDALIDRTAMIGMGGVIHGSAGGDKAMAPDAASSQTSASLQDEAAPGIGEVAEDEDVGTLRDFRGVRYHKYEDTADIAELWRRKEASTEGLDEKEAALSKAVVPGALSGSNVVEGKRSRQSRLIKHGQHTVLKVRATCCAGCRSTSGRAR